MKHMTAAALLLVLAGCNGGSDKDSTPTVSLALQSAFPALGNFTQPVQMLQAPGNANKWFVVEHTGKVKIFDNSPAVTACVDYLDVTPAMNGAIGGEMGLQSIAFHPNWPTNPRMYVSYTAYDGLQLVSRIAEYRSTDGGATIDPTTAMVVLQVAQPEDLHNGGYIAFGPDGYLYIGFGDGGTVNDVGDPHGAYGNAQRLSTLLGKMLRIDVDGTTGATKYAIPPSNPYAGNAVCDMDAGNFTENCPEVWAYGFRNPWRWSFDRQNGDLWVADVGQDNWEEINRVEKGGNYGWRCREGNHAYNDTCGPHADSVMPPVAEYSHDEGAAAIGGYVYRGTAIPQLAGKYVFGDWSSGRIWTIATDTQPTKQLSGGFETGLAITAFGQALDGELYLVDYAGSVQKIVAGAGN
jgi:glucose/arabinose dehydrogenase